MKGRYLMFFLVVSLASFVVDAPNKAPYTEVPDEKPKSETVTGSQSTGPVNKTLDNATSNGKSKTNTASIAVRVMMGILGVVCYELKECRESLNVQAAVTSVPTETTQTPYTFLPRYNISTGKSSFVTSNSADTGRSSNVTSSAPSFYYRLASDWSASPNTKAGKVNIYPRSNGGGAPTFKTGIILGVKGIPSGSIYAEAQNYLQRMVETNQYLSNSSDFSSKTIGNKQCYYKQLVGFSKDLNANETVTFFACQQNQNTMFYSVVVYNDKTTESDKQSLWQIWNTVEF